MRTRLLTAVATLALLSVPAHADDWLQWGGPDGDFTVDVTGLAEQWPTDGPRQLWKRPLGEGYSAILYKDGTLFTMYRVDDDEIVVVLDAKTGKTSWEHRYTRTAFWDDMRPQFGLGPIGFDPVDGSGWRRGLSDHGLRASPCRAERRDRLRPARACQAGLLRRLRPLDPLRGRAGLRQRFGRRQERGRPQDRTPSPRKAGVRSGLEADPSGSHPPIRGSDGVTDVTVTPVTQRPKVTGVTVTPVTRRPSVMDENFSSMTRHPLITDVTVTPVTRRPLITDVTVTPVTRHPLITGVTVTPVTRRPPITGQIVSSVTMARAQSSPSSPRVFRRASSICFATSDF